MSITTATTGAIFQANQAQRFIGGFSEDGTRFRWRVRAGSDAGWGEWLDYRNFIRDSPIVTGFYTIFGTDVSPLFQEWVRNPDIF